MADDLNVEKVSEVFNEYMTIGGKNDIEALFETIPYFTSQQKKVYAMLSFFDTKYNLPRIRSFIDDYKGVEKENRSSITFKKCIEAMALKQHFKGLKLNLGD